MSKPAVPNLPFWWTATDQTMHWADPLNGELNDCAMAAALNPGLPPVPPCNQNYSGPVPAVVHLHGGEVPPQLDGGPDAWFTSAPVPAPGTQQGHGYYSFPVGAANAATYQYPNTQEAAPAWFHDHVLGITRLNVYAGLAGGYIITDNTTNPPPVDLNDPTKIIPLVIQDRMFDVNGQLYFPSIGINPEHPFWVPEFVGDTIAVNGKTWPYIEVEPFKYRFLFLNGSNARAYQLDFKVQGKGKSPTFWVISTDGGYLDAPVPVQQLTIMPGERYGVIVDFAGFRPGTTLLLQNSARTPFPGGAPVNRSTTGRVMEFRVIDPLVTPYTMPPPPQTTFTPTALTPLRSSNPIEKLAPTIVTPAQDPIGHTPIRRLTLNEVMGPGGPLEVLVNNTKWSGESARTYGDFVPVLTGGITTLYSELPKEGSTEVWEVINMTADAHPIHLHLVQFQLLSRQPFDARRYMAAYDLAFPGGIYRPAFGPPLPYTPVIGGVSDPTLCSEPGAVCGGNPDPGALGLLLGVPAPPLPQEQGWKDTVIMYPGEVTRIAVRWAPQDATATVANYFPFDPNGGHGYVWHCHIIDHEDNEMMRPDLVQLNPAASRTVLGPNGPNY
jgi:FtsP/CotA-like multicopper oxidase with cupredoxin domain